MDSKTKQMILSALCKHLSVDPTGLGGSDENDVKTLYSNVLKASGKEVSSQNNEEVLKWLEFAAADSKDRYAAIEKLNVELAVKSVVLGNGLSPSAADVAVFAALHSSVIGLSDSDKEKIPHVIRWMNYIQIKEELFGPISVKLPQFDFEVSKSVAEVDANANTKKAAESAKPTVDKSEAQPTSKKAEPEEPKKKAKDAKKEKKKPAEATPPPANKETELSVSMLNIQVGLIRKTWKHPSADSLLVEEIDVGEGKVRQVVSGLAKFCSPDDLASKAVKFSSSSQNLDVKCSSDKDAPEI